MSLGAFMSVVKKDQKHFKTGKSFRYYSKDSDAVFHYPYMLTSAAHNFQDMDFRKTIGFEENTKGLFFGDSGGFQLLTGKAPKGFTRELGFEWMEKNCDVYPLLDMPFPKTFNAVSDEYFNKSIEFTKESAKYFLDNRTRDDNIILNVVQGRDLNEIE